MERETRKDILRTLFTRYLTRDVHSCLCPVSQAPDVAKFVPIERSAVNLATLDDVVELVRPLIEKHFKDVWL